LKPSSGSSLLRPTRAALFSLAVVLALLTVFPLFWMVSSAFKGPDEVNSVNLIPTAPTLDNFRYVFTEVPFLRYMLNSLFVATVVTVAALWFHSMAAYALARLRFPGRDLLFFAIFSTLLVALPIILVPLFILVRELGMLDSYVGLIVPAIFNAFGIFLLRQFYIGMPQELEDAAFVDGCGYWGVYWHVILPLSRPILAALAVFFFLANWNSFLWPLTITQNQDLWMIQVAISSFQTQYAGAWNYIMAAATVAAIPTMALFFVFQRQLVESIKTSGFK
jgi:multiple sugar transport system permease protein